MAPGVILASFPVLHNSYICTIACSTTHVTSWLSIVASLIHKLTSIVYFVCSHRSRSWDRERDRDEERKPPKNRRRK